MKPVVQSFGLDTNVQACFVQTVEITQWKFPGAIKNIRSSFFYFGARNINTVTKVRFGCATRCLCCCHPCLNVRNPYFILRARPTFAGQYVMAIILMWVVACAIKAGQLRMLLKIRSLPFCLCSGLRIFFITCEHILSHSQIKLRKLITLRLSRTVHLFMVY